MEWIGASMSGFGAIGPASRTSIYIVLPSQAAAFTDATLVRTRGLFVPAEEIVSAGVTGDTLGAIGIISWDDINDTVPAPSDAPSPIIDTDFDWLFHSYWAVRGGTLDGQGHYRMEIDSRAMRRLGNNKGVLAVIENAQAVNDLTFWFGARCLLKE